MADITKAIRISKEDWAQIQQFLRKNSFFDFSTLVRVSLKHFIKNPKLDLISVEDAPVKQTIKSSKSNEAVQNV